MFYWIFTSLMLMLMLFSGVSGLINPEQSKTLITGHLGYPEYFVSLVSAVKIFGVVAILIPGFPRLKEWAYAGFVFDLGMAIYSFIAVGDPIAGTWFIWFGLILVFGSYIFYHKKKKTVLTDRATGALETEPEVSLG